MTTEVENRAGTPAEKLMFGVAGGMKARALERIDVERKDPEKSAYVALVWYVAAQQVISEVMTGELPPGGLWALLPADIRGSVDRVAATIRATCRNKLNN